MGAAVDSWHNRDAGQGSLNTWRAEQLLRRLVRSESAVRLCVGLQFGRQRTVDSRRLPREADSDGVGPVVLRR